MKCLYLGNNKGYKAILRIYLTMLGDNYNIQNFLNTLVLSQLMPSTFSYEDATFGQGYNGHPIPAK